MGTGAIDLPNAARISDREFSLSGIDPQSGDAPRQHVQQLVDAVGLHSIPSGTIQGTVFLDPNENGSLGNSEVGLSGVTVYVDYNNDAVHDPGEPSAVSDFVGDYQIDNIVRENVIVRQTSELPLRQTGSEATTLAFTEFFENSPDFVEVQNLSPEVVNTSGWLLASNNGLDTAFGINNVHPVTFELPKAFGAGEILTVTDQSGDANFWGSNLNFLFGTGGWLLLIDDQGQVRDSFFAGFSAEEIAALDVTINGQSYTATDVNWNGDGVPLTYGAGSYQRVGTGDTNTSLDYVLQTESQDAPNEGLSLPGNSQASGRRVLSISGRVLSNVNLGSVFTEQQADSFFTAATNSGNRELHFLEGNTGQIRLVRDLAGNVSSEPQELTATSLGNEVLFTAEDASGQRELYKSDGTFSGTALVRDLSGATSSAPAELTSVGAGTFLFSAAMSNGDRELYRTQGTSSTTQLVRDLSGVNESDPRDLTPLQGQVFFSATTNSGQRELYVSDGTFSGTRLVRDLSGSTSSDPRDLTVVGNRLYFTAVTASGEREVFISDGTNSGTGIVKNVNGNISADPRELTGVGPKLFFSAALGSGERELYVTDGTAAGTRVVENLPGNGNPRLLTAVLSKLYFVGRASGGQRELYLSSNGSGAKLVRDLNGTTGSSPQELTALGNVLLFTAIRPNGNRELHRSEGIFAQTLPIRDLSGSTDAEPENLTVVGNRILFSTQGSDGQRELYQTAGTTVSTGRIANLGGGVSSDPGDFAEVFSVAIADLPRPSQTAVTFDHNGDGVISARDALFVINRLAQASSSLGSDRETVLGDTTGDGVLSPLDALRIINRLDSMSNATDFLDGGDPPVKPS